MGVGFYFHDTVYQYIHLSYGLVVLPSGVVAAVIVKGESETWKVNEQTEIGCRDLDLVE